VDPAGSKNLFHYEVTPYDPGSDHDMFNDSTVGVPALMFGHWPDWTHHTSEDTVDKVDPTTLKRVGVLATSAALWLATADDKAVLGDLAYKVKLTALRNLTGRGDTPLGVKPTARMASLLSTERARIQSLEHLLSPEGQAQVDRKVREFEKQLPGDFAELLRVLSVVEKAEVQKRGPFPRRLFVGPLGDSYASMWFREALGEGYGWWRDWEGKVPHWEIFVYEVLNYTDGERSLSEIEEAVEAEFGDIPDGVVEHILRDLEKVGLVEFTAPKAQ
jgi:hypothetical protein